ncbi:MAG: hypothetical protein FD126_846, partial [Elusimicrobia bacterium]
DAARRARRSGLSWEDIRQTIETLTHEEP